jgi:hypothetical protein
MNIKSIKKEVVVEAAQSTAFKVFTEKMDLWWPSSHHIGKTPLTGTVLEPHVKGRWYTKHEDGSECNVGSVIEWNPYDQVILSWQINGNYQYDSELITEIVVNFLPEGPKTTKVQFEHKNLQRMAGLKSTDDMDIGWGMIMDVYQTYINSLKN